MSASRRARLSVLPLIGDELDGDLGMSREERTDLAREHAGHEPLRGGDAHDTREARGLARDAVLDREHFLLDALGIGEDLGARA